MNSKSIMTLGNTLLLLLCCIMVKGQTINYSGKLTDKQSHPISSASVRILNTNIATVSDNEGIFHFNKLTAGKYIMEITAIGYASINRELQQTQTVQATVDLLAAIENGTTNQLPE